MFTILKVFCSRISILYISTVMLAFSLSGFSQSGKGQIPPVDSAAQRAEQADQAQQQQQQQIQDESLRRRTEDLAGLEARMRAEGREREQLRQAIRENFRRRYQVLRTNAEAIVQLTSALQAYVQNDEPAGLSREMLAKTGRMQKLAHEIRTTMTGRKLPRIKSLEEEDTTGVSPASLADRRQLLIQKINASSALAAGLQTNIAAYLANDNEHAVSVKALKTSAETQLDPQLVSVMLASTKLEHLAASIRADAHRLSALQAVLR